MAQVLNSNNLDESNSGKPIRFVYCDDNGKFKLDPDAIDILRQIEGPVAVVSVCGPPRQGKSFILNQLLGRSTGFQVASTPQPCTEGLWMWSMPLKRTALDETEYNLLLLDTGGINASDQTGIYSARICSLAVLLSSFFVYNQVGVIDEAAIDHLSLVTEMTKHIHGRVSEGKDLVSDLGHFSPVFMWLLRDFYLDLTKDNIKITPRDYLELALRPVLGSGKHIAAKNQIRDSIRAVFPNRECFTLVRPLNNELDLQHLDRVSVDKFRPEFWSGLDAFIKFVYERTKPKQVRGTVMTGPCLADITKSFLDVLNNYAIPTISSSWQDCTGDAFRESDLQCSNAAQSMEQKLQGALLVADARIENVAMVLESLISEYEASVHGPMKWQKLSFFLRKSLQGPIIHHVKKLVDEVSLERSSLTLKCQSIEDKIELLHKQLQASEKLKGEYQKGYENAINDFKKLSDRYKSRIIDLESNCSLLEERCSSSLDMLDSAKQESLRWERKYEEILTKERAVNDHDNDKAVDCKSGICAAAAQSRLALKEASEWKEKYDMVVNEAKAAIEKAAKEAKLKEEHLSEAAEQSRLAQQEASEWKEKYDIAVNEAKAAIGKAAEEAKLKEEHLSEAAEQSMLAWKDASEWKEKYDIAVNEAKTAVEKAAEEANLRGKHLSEAAEQSRLAWKEASEWKEKYDIAVNEAKAAIEKAAKEAKLREEGLSQAAEQSTLAWKEASEWKEKYNIAVIEATAAVEKAAEEAKLREEDLSQAAEQSRLARKEASEWKEKYVIAVNEAKAAVDKGAEEPKPREEDLSADVVQSRLAWKEASEWKEKYNIAVSEAKAAMEKAFEEANLREEDLRARFTNILVEKDEEIKDKVTKLEVAGQRLTTLTLEWKAAETKIESSHLESSDLKLQIKDLAEKYEFVKAAAQSMEREAQTLIEDRIQLEQKYLSELKRFEEAPEKFKVAEGEAKVANEFIETAQSEVLTVQNEKRDSQQLNIDKHAQTRSAPSPIEILEREKMELAGEVERSTALEGYAMAKVALLEAMVRDRDQEIGLLKKKCEGCASSVQILDNSLEFGHVEHAEANIMEKAPSLQLEPVEERLNLLQQDVTPDHSNESAMDSMLKTYSGRKRSRLEVNDVSFYSVPLMNHEEKTPEMRRPKSISTLQKCTTSEVDSVFKENEEDSEYQKAASVDYTKLTVVKLRQELNEHGFGDELQKLRYPKKKDIVALYKKLILNK